MFELHCCCCNKMQSLDGQAVCEECNRVKLVAFGQIEYFAELLDRATMSMVVSPNPIATQMTIVGPCRENLAEKCTQS